MSLGGIIVSASKMCIKGIKGIKIGKLKNLINKFEYFFSEDQGRYIIEVKKENHKKVEDNLTENSVHFDNLGTVTKGEILIDDEQILSIDELIECNKIWFKNYMVN